MYQRESQRLFSGFASGPRFLGGTMAQILQVAAIAVVTLGTGAATLTAMNGDVPDYSVPDGDWSRGSALDGRVFYTVDTIVETGEILTDELVFRDGTFQSVMCQAYCDFGWSDYQTKREGDVIHFTARTECPDAPHTVVFYGTVVGDEIRFEGTWTTRRWYWTHQINVTGLGSPTPPAGDGVSG